MRVFAVPKIYAIDNKEKLIATKDALVISIIDSNVEPVFNNEHHHIKTFFFDDIHPTTVNTIGGCYDYRPMKIWQAKDLIHFVMSNVDESINSIIVHCTAGVCRSGAIVDFLRVILDVDDIQFARDNPNILPNTWVRDLLWSVWSEKGN